jgi:hypothetical protein
VKPSLRATVLCLLPCLLLVSPARGQGSSTSERRFDVPYYGALVMQVPADWNAQFRQPRWKKPPTITITPSSGPPFRFLVSFLWTMTKKGAGYRLPEDDRAFVAQAATRAKGRAVEEELPVVEFKGRSGPGYYFSSTDRIATPEEFKLLTEGVVQVDGVSVTFTILTNPGQEDVVKRALAILKAAEMGPDDQ